MSEWHFINLFEMEMTLDSIIHYQRPTRRHRWKIAREWSRLFERQCTMEREEPPIDVKCEVRQMVTKAICFK